MDTFWRICRLNQLTVLQVHKDKLDTLDVDEIAKAFIAKCDSRHATFERLWQCSVGLMNVPLPLRTLSLLNDVGLADCAVPHVDELW